MARLFDLHIHTTKGSSDSKLSPEDLILEADRMGLRGLCLTEHSGPWDLHEFRRFADLHNVVLIRAMEVETDMGHVLAFGMDEYQPGFHKVETLSKAAKAAGGFIVTAHPFRAFNRPMLYKAGTAELPVEPEDAMNHPIFKLVNAVEVANGGTADDENDFAMKVAGVLNMPVTGGSDAHSTHGIGRFVTAFRNEINNQEEFLAALHAGSFHPAVGLRTGELRPYTV